MNEINGSKEELINEINILKIQNANLKKELNFYKENNKIKEKYKIDITCLESILDAMPSAVVIINAEDEKFIYLNKRAKELYGINYLGYNFDSYSNIIKAFKLDGSPYPKEEMPMVSSLKYGKEVRNKDILIEKPNGVKLSISLSSAPIFDAKGTVTLAIAIFEDVTELKRIEEELK